MGRKEVSESVTACELMNTGFMFCGFYCLLNGTRIKVMASLNQRSVYSFSGLRALCKWLHEPVSTVWAVGLADGEHLHPAWVSPDESP